MSGAGGSLSTLFFRNRHLLVMAILVVIVAGVSALRTLPRLEDPRIATRNALIITLMPGASAQRVEALVTEKLENALDELSEIKDINSTSRAGISLVAVELQAAINYETNDTAFAKIRAKLRDAERLLPAEASRPNLDDNRGATAFNLIVSLSWADGTEAALGTLGRLSDQLADRLRTLPGTELVRVHGDPQEQVLVTVDAGQLAALGLSMPQLGGLVAQADPKLAAGAVRTPDTELLIELAGELDSVDRVRQVAIARNGAGGVITLGDIAKVEKTWADPPASVAIRRGQRAVFVSTRSTIGVRVDKWAASAREVIEQFGAELGDDISVELLFDQSGYTEARLSQLSGNLIAGALIVALVVFVAMGWRSALIVGSALPLSAAAALFGFSFLNQQIHQMSIFGLIIAVGLLIDNAIVITDEVRQKLDAGLDRLAAVKESVEHLFVPLLASTMTTVLGFMPIFLLPGNAGDFISPIAKSVVLALVASFVLSMTVVAALAGRYVKSAVAGEPTPWWRYGISGGKMSARYRRMLQRALRYRRATVAACLVLPLLGFALASQLGVLFFPPAERDQFSMEVWLSPGTSIERTRAVTEGIDALLKRQQGVRSVDWVVGSSFPSVYYNHIMDTENAGNYAQASVLVDSVRRAKQMVADLPALLDPQFPQAQIIVNPFWQGPPSESPIGYRLVGPDMRVLQSLGEEVRRVMTQMPAVTHTRASVSGGQAKLSFEADEMEARLAGLSLTQIAQQLQGSLEGQAGGSVLEDIQELPVRLRLSNAQRGDMSAVENFQLVSSLGPEQGRWTPSSALGQFTIQPELSSITRFNRVRVNEISGYIKPQYLPIEVSREILVRLDEAGFVLPPGYRMDVSGEEENQSDALGALAIYLPVLIVLMLTTIVLSFRSATTAGIIGAVAVFSVGLGLLSLALSGFPMGFNPMLGSIGLLGVAINGSIVVLAAIRQDRAALAGDAAAIIEQTIASTRHILATTVTTIAGFVPLLVVTGGDFWPPLAIVMAGGVGLSVTLSLVFTPSLYHWIYSSRTARQRTDVGGALGQEA